MRALLAILTAVIISTGCDSSPPFEPEPKAGNDSIPTDPGTVTGYWSGDLYLTHTGCGSHALIQTVEFSVTPTEQNLVRLEMRLDEPAAGPPVIAGVEHTLRLEATLQGRCALLSRAPGQEWVHCLWELHGDGFRYYEVATPSAEDPQTPVWRETRGPIGDMSLSNGPTGRLFIHVWYEEPVPCTPLGVSPLDAEWTLIDGRRIGKGNMGR